MPLESWDGNKYTTYGTYITSLGNSQPTAPVNQAVLSKLDEHIKSILSQYQSQILNSIFGAPVWVRDVDLGIDPDIEGDW